MAKSITVFVHLQSILKWKGHYDITGKEENGMFRETHSIIRDRPSFIGRTNENKKARESSIVANYMEGVKW